MILGLHAGARKAIKLLPQLVLIGDQSTQELSHGQSDVLLRVLGGGLDLLVHLPGDATEGWSSPGGCHATTGATPRRSESRARRSRANAPFAGNQQQRGDEYLLVVSTTCACDGRALPDRANRGARRGNVRIDLRRTVDGVHHAPGASREHLLARKPLTCDALFVR